MTPSPAPTHPARLVLLLALLVSAPPALAAGPLDPKSFASLGTLTLAGGGFTIDTSALEIRTASGTLLFTGVADDQEGAADYLNNVWVPGSNGIPEIAVFSFDQIDLQSTATITVVGSRALALLSRGNASIGTTIKLSPADLVVPSLPGPRTTGIGGGFNGAALQQSGDGPGRGGNVVGPFGGGPAGHGGPGFLFSFGGPAGLVYGDLLQGPLQGGSGGGGQGTLSGGAAGGGALEISAVGSVTLAASASLIAAGGKVFELNLGNGTHVGGGSGSGGGIRLQGQSVNVLGQIDAGAFRMITDNIAGGGRVAIFGYSQLPEFTVGVTTPGAINTSMIDVEGGRVPENGSHVTPIGRGVITITPRITTVPFAQSLVLGQVADLSDANRRLFLTHHEIRVLDGGTASVPAGGFVHRGRIELISPGSRIGGSDPLENRGAIRGTGRIEVALANAATGTVNAVHDALTFTAPVANNAGAEINAIQSTLDFQGGLTNAAGSQLNLINSMVSGSVANLAAAGVTVAGVAIFDGEVRGGSDFAGSGTVAFQGGYRPGESPAEVAFDGGVVFGADNTLWIEIGGLAPGSEHDRLDVAGTTAFGGALDLALVGGFAPSAGQTLVLITHGARTGEFASIAGISLGALDLAVDYGATALTVTAALRGDVNQDGVVDALDRARVEQNLGLATTAYSAGDVDGSGTVDAADLAVVVAQLDVAIPAVSAAGLVVLLAALALVGVRQARRAALV